MSLKKQLLSLFFEGSIETGDMTYVSNSRHIALIGQALHTIEDAIRWNRNGNSN